MIHVAPCSCELHVRIRELEAELARLGEAGLTVPEARKEWQEMQARAEKAEEELLWFKDDNGRLQLRVAELENHIRRYSRGLTTGIVVEPALAIEGQEREAD